MGEKRNYFNEGQTDASEGKNDPPHKVMPIVGDIFTPNTKEERADREQYREGQKHHKDQTK